MRARLAPDPAPDRRLDLAADGFLSVADAAAFLSVSEAGLYVLMGDGRVPYTHVGRRRLIPKKALVELAAKNMVGAG
jgi:excisionase family DNA binding protein